VSRVPAVARPARGSTGPRHRDVKARTQALLHRNSAEAAGSEPDYIGVASVGHCVIASLRRARSHRGTPPDLSVSHGAVHARIKVIVDAPMSCDTCRHGPIGEWGLDPIDAARYARLCTLAPPHEEAAPKGSPLVAHAAVSTKLPLYPVWQTAGFI
jgi:hypothetical protein